MIINSLVAVAVPAPINPIQASSGQEKMAENEKLAVESATSANSRRHVTQFSMQIGGICAGGGNLARLPPCVK